MRAIFIAAVMCAAASLSGCASVDKALFGGSGLSESAAEPSTAPPAPDTEDADQADAATPAGQPPAEQTAQAEPGTPMPGTLPPATGEPAAPPSSAASAPPSPDAAAAAAPEVSVPPPPSAAPPPAQASSEPVAPPPAQVAAPVVAAPIRAPVGATAGGPAISPVVIASGVDTGTAVNHTIAGWRASLQEIANRLSGTGQQYATLRSSSAQQLAIYYQAQAQISARLQIGTTRGNPELVSQWNAGQAALDQLTANINALGALGTQINGDSARTRTLLAQLQGALGMAGGTEEDQRQLGVIEDEANQVIVVLDRLARDISADLRRQTVTLTNERSRLAQLAEAIKAGDLYASAGRRNTMLPGSPTGVSVGSAAGQPIVTIRFGRRAPNYQKTLYTALNQALQAQPNASFEVAGVSQTGGSAGAVQAAQTNARRHAQEVLRTMGEMGVPAVRMQVMAVTDPSVAGSEVRVIVR